MPGQPVKIGPFVGGMNTYSGPSSIGDNEAVLLRNLDVDLDGSLSSRYPIARSGAPAGFTTQPSRVLGYYREAATDIVYIIFDYNAALYAANTAVNVWIKIADGKFTAVAQYADKLFCVKKPAGAATGGGQWDPTNGYVAVATMPRGYASCIYKERMFISCSRNATDTSINRVAFSAPANPASWNTSTDTFDVSGGDGQDIVSLKLFDSSIAIFKTDSTFVFAYESSPAKGQVQVVSNSIGANNVQSVIEYENNLFVIHEANVYRISNWNWEHTNIKVPFDYVNSYNLSPDTGSSLSVVGNRLMCRYYDKYYILGFKTGAWTTWTFHLAGITTPGEFLASPNIDPSIGSNRYYGGSYTGQSPYYYTYVDKPGLFSENYPVSIISKAYDFGTPYTFKRLFWWGVDLLANSLTSFKVAPLVYSTPITWGQVGAVPISQIMTWGRPLDFNIDVTDSASLSNPTQIRTFVKLLKGLRFRQAQFTLETTVKGTDPSPYRIFSLTAVVDSKEMVTDKVS